MKRPEVSNAKSGGGALAYQGSSWSGGHVFVGQQLTSQNAVIRLSSEAGLDTLHCMVNSAGALVSTATCANTRFGVLVPCPSGIQSVSAVKEQLKTVPKHSINKEKNTVIGSASSTRMLEFVHPENDKLAKALLKYKRS